MRSCLLLVNPNARSGAETMTLARDGLARAGFAVEALWAQSPETVDAAIRSTQADLVVLGGGDGTISSAAPVLLQTGKTVGVLPLGTANDLAGSLGIPKNLEEAVGIVAEGEARAIDIGYVNDRPFFNAVTLGLGAEVIRAHKGPMKRLLGVLNYPRVIIQSMRRRRYFKARISTGDTDVVKRWLHIGIANGRYHGGGLPVHEEATIDDGILHLYAVRRATPWRYIKALPALLTGRPARGDILRLASARFSIHTEKPMTVTADGEEIGTTPLELRCAPKALTIMTPVSGVAGADVGAGNE